MREDMALDEAQSIKGECVGGARWNRGATLGIGRELESVDNNLVHAAGCKHIVLI